MVIHGYTLARPCWQRSYPPLEFVWLPSTFNDRTSAGSLLGQINVRAIEVGELKCTDERPCQPKMPEVQERVVFKAAPRVEGVLV